MFSVILVMAGVGARYGASKNKALIDLNSKPLFTYPLNQFIKLGYEIILVINKDDLEEVKKEVSNNVKIVFGGTSRQESVYNGLKEVKTKFVMIHDAARAFIDIETIKKVEEKIIKGYQVFSAIEVVDTIREITTEGFKTLDRSKLLAVQTPQGGETDVFLGVHQKACNENFIATDDIQLIEKYSDKLIGYIIGSQNNFKVTYPKDLLIGEKVVLGND